MRPWLLIVGIVVVVAGTSFAVHRWTVSEAVEAGRPTAERRTTERTTQQQKAARVDTLVNLLTVLEQKLVDRPMDSMLVISAANVSYDLGQFDKAERYYRRYIDKIDNSSIPAQIDLAFVIFQQGRKDEAADLLRSIISRDPKNQTAMYNLAYMLDQMGDAKGSKEMMQQVRDADPTSQLGRTAKQLLKR
jgi:tetratricopeptide (TPR) repeat protein